MADCRARTETCFAGGPGRNGANRSGETRVERMSTLADVGSVRALAHVLDRAIRIPGTNFRVGLDGILGLVPGFGDAAGAALSGVIVLAAIRAGASRAVLGRMLANVALDTALGAIPVVGDLFDFAWKANARNATLLERFLEDPAPTRRASARFVALVVVALVGLLGVALWVAFLVARALLGG